MEELSSEVVQWVYPKLEMFSLIYFGKDYVRRGLDFLIVADSESNPVISLDVDGGRYVVHNKDYQDRARVLVDRAEFLTNRALKIERDKLPFYQRWFNDRKNFRYELVEEF